MTKEEAWGTGEKTALAAMSADQARDFINGFN
jgi:hypothetical protein